MQQKVKRRRPRWDAYRRIAAWLGLLMPVVALLAPLLTGAPLFTGEVSDALTNLTVGLLIYPAMVAGAVSGSRFFAVYAGYAERDLPTEPLPDDDSARGYGTTFLLIGDWCWGGLVAGLSGGLVLAVMVAPTQEHDPVEIVFFALFTYPLLAFTVAMAWILGALIGTFISVLLSSAVGILFGLRKRADRRGTATWSILALLLPLAGVSAFGMYEVRSAEGGLSAWARFRFLVGDAVPGAEFALGPGFLWVFRIAAWGAMVVFLVLIAIGVPAYLERRRA